MPLWNINTRSESRSLSNTRSARRRRSKRLQKRADTLKARFKELQRQFLDLKKQHSDTISELEIAEAELTFRSLIEQPETAPRIDQERPMPGFQFNLTMISTAIELGKRVGYRAAEDALQIVFDMLKMKVKVPSHDAIEQWTLRLGVASLNETFKKGERILWMSDHSSQIGKERLVMELLSFVNLLRSLSTTEKRRLFWGISSIVRRMFWKKKSVVADALKPSFRKWG